MIRSLAAALLFVPVASLAGTATSNMNVTATVSNTCTISAGALAFGAYDSVAGTQVDGTATLTVACTIGSTNAITLGQGANADAGSSDTVPLRRLNDGGSNYISYDLYSDSGRTTVWGNDVGTSVSYAAASSASDTVTVYGRISASQDVPAASYTDTVVATITF